MNNKKCDKKVSLKRSIRKWLLTPVLNKVMVFETLYAFSLLFIKTISLSLLVRIYCIIIRYQRSEILCLCVGRIYSLLFHIRSKFIHTKTDTL